MGYCNAFTSPSDPRWQGPHSAHHVIFCIKNVFLGLLIIMAIAEFSVLDQGIRDGSITSMEDSDVNAMFWLAVGAPFFADLLYTLAAHALIFQTPKITTGGRTWSFHPAVALSFSLLFFLTWPFFAWLQIAEAAWDEEPIPSEYTWRGLGNACVAFEAIIAFCYLCMVPNACMAVHSWRHTKKAPENKSNFIQLKNDDREVKSTPPPSYRSDLP